MSNSILTIDVIAKEALRLLEFKAPADALPICQLRDPDERFTEDETLANGFLIAAAPDLYGQLESGQTDLNLLRRAIEKNDPRAELLIRVTDLWKRNETALAKARGDAA